MSSSFVSDVIRNYANVKISGFLKPESIYFRKVEQVCVILSLSPATFKFVCVGECAQREAKLGPV